MGVLNNLMESITAYSETAIHKTHERYHSIHGTLVSEGGVNLFIL